MVQIHIDLKSIDITNLKKNDISKNKIDAIIYAFALLCIPSISKKFATN